MLHFATTCNSFCLLFDLTLIIMLVIETRSTEFLNPGQTCFFSRRLGNCSNSETKWYFDSQRLTCQTFTFSGCNGNFNNFQSEAECLNACNGFKLPLQLRSSPGIGASVDYARKEPFGIDNATIGQQINLLCKVSVSSGDPEIEYCKWTRPPIPMEDFNISDFSNYDNRSFVFPSRTTGNTTGFSFYGEGLVNGQCGLTIHKVAEDDFGFWTCLLIKKQRSFDDRIVAFKSAIKVNSSLQLVQSEDEYIIKKLGIGMGIFVSAAIVLVAIGLLIWARKSDKWCFRNVGKRNAKRELDLNPEESTLGVPLNA